MRIDVSEVKTFRTCKRQWQLSSRNYMHLTATKPAPALIMGTKFHEALGKLYLGIPLDKVMSDLKDGLVDGEEALLNMIPGYAREVLPFDLERFTVLDIEHHFSFVPTTSQGEVFDPDLMICGSIDMIVLEEATGKVFGFEHKTTKNFREENFIWMDEQPRVYTKALQQYVNRMNEHAVEEWEARGADQNNPPQQYEVGGIFLNEVKKLLRQFQYQRTLCQYTDEDLDNFFDAFLNTCAECKKYSSNESLFPAPTPSYFACQMCSFKSVCSTYMYNNLHRKEILDSFSDEFKEREMDHLDEKTEVSTQK
jgi:CRISPR/Cas system-associated exonuclease Cas4 (RecB family)